MSQGSEPAVHQDVAPVAWLLGTWRGEGSGAYPTIEPFRYGEEVRFWHVGKPFVAFAQRTWALDDRRPLHAEAGYLRPKPDGVVELVLAEPSGFASLYEGRVADGRIDLATTTIAAAPTAKEVTQVRRVYRLRDDGVLAYTLAMAAVGQPLTHHLAASLRKVPA
jgi:THAP4-like, heme-binding beta-barrel domain